MKWASGEEGMDKGLKRKAGNKDEESRRRAGEEHEEEKYRNMFFL